jgi:hypothetical protein
MTIIHRIRQKILNGEFVFSVHTLLDKLPELNLTTEDVIGGILDGEIIEKLTEDPRGIRYVILGYANDEREIKIVCRFRADKKLIIITAYEPFK